MIRDKPHFYETEIRFIAKPTSAFSAGVLVTVKRGSIVVTAPAIEAAGHKLAEEWSRTTLAAIQRARRAHRRVFGRPA